MLQECYVCGEVLCEDCLTEMADVAGMSTEGYQAMQLHPETGEAWCPDCWSKDPEEQSW